MSCPFSGFRVMGHMELILCQSFRHTNSHTHFAGVECGCDADTAPSPDATLAPTTPTSDLTPVPTPSFISAPVATTSGSTPAPVAVSPSTTPSVGDSCSDGDSFAMSVPLLPDAEGCYLNTNLELNDELVYSRSGGVDGGEVWVVGVPATEDIDAEVRERGLCDVCGARSLVWAQEPSLITPRCYTGRCFSPLRRLDPCCFFFFLALSLRVGCCYKNVNFVKDVTLEAVEGFNGKAVLNALFSIVSHEM